MTGKVIEFKKRDGKKPHQRPNDQLIPQIKAKTNQEIFQDVTEDVLGEWQRYAVKNQLNDYFISKLPKRVAGDTSRNFVNDLNVLAEVEEKLGLKIAVFYPECTPSQLGWLVATHRGKDIFGTPTDMATEAYARAINILLQLSLEYHLKTLGRA